MILDSPAVSALLTFLMWPKEHGKNDERNLVCAKAHLHILVNHRAVSTSFFQGTCSNF